MKKLRSLLSILSVVLLFQTAYATEGNNKKGNVQQVDVQKSNINWLGKKVSGEHYGAIKLEGGSLIVDNGKIKGGDFTIDMNSITVEDIKDAETNGKLVGHLKADDFFGVEKNPKATFKITKVTQDKAGKAQVTGDLTIKGITNSITFPAVVKTTKNGTVATAKFDIDRTKWDIKYGSKTFFESIGDKAIYDNFTIDLKLVTVAKGV